VRKIITVVSAVSILSIACQVYALERTTIIKEILRPRGAAKAAGKITTPEPDRFEFGVGAWPTTGRLDSFVYASDEWFEGGILRAKQGDTLSHLQNKLNSTMIIMDIGAYLFGFLYADASLGAGQFRGQHKDYDWWPQYRSDYSSLYFSSADGNTITWDANAELRCIDWNAGKSFVDLSLGYLYYRDSIVHLHDTTTVVAQSFQPSNEPLAGHDSQDKYTFDGFRIGARMRWEVFDRIAFKGRAGVLPWMNAVNIGWWNLRSAKFESNANGAAVDLMGGFEFRITKNFLIEAGYKYMYLKSYRGMQRAYLDSTASYNEKAFSAKAERSGFYFMGRLTM
jgi:hypothetical protein